MGLRTLVRQLRFESDLPYRLYDRVAVLLGQGRPGLPLRSARDDQGPAPFFIVGSGRSGNTLLRAILVGHGKLAIPPESYVLGTVVRDYRRLGFLAWSELLRIVLARFHFHPKFGTWDTDLREVHEQLVECPESERSLARIVNGVYQAWMRCHMPSASRWGDKTPTNVYHLPRIHRLFPDAAFVHMLRDGRDVVASYLESGLYESAIEACDRWRESVHLVRSFLRRLPADRYREIRYERLVGDPEGVTRDVCDLLGVSFERRMLEHRTRVDDLGDTGARHHADLRRPISDRSVGSWRNRLDLRQQAVVQERLQDMLEVLGYLQDGGAPRSEEPRQA